MKFKDGDLGKQELAFVAMNISKARAFRMWSLSDVAAKTGLSKSFLSALESENTSPNLATLAVLADVFEHTIGDLISKQLYQYCPHCNGVGIVAKDEK